MYQSILEEVFTIFLQRQGASKKTQKNYCTDMRHFMTWLTVSIIPVQRTHPRDHVELVSLITNDVLHLYRDELLNHNVPAGTINRRLSALRMFLSACQHRGWITGEMTVDIKNVKQGQLAAIETVIQNKLKQWETTLSSQGVSDATIRSYTHDVREFLKWVHTQRKNP